MSVCQYVSQYVCMYVFLVCNSSRSAILNMVCSFYQALEEVVAVMTFSTAIEQDLVTDNLSLTEF